MSTFDRPRLAAPKTLRPVSTSSARTPPHDVEAEGAVLSACLDGGAPTVAALRLSLAPEHFYAGRHRLIFEACLRLLEDGLAVTLPAVAVRLTDEGRFDRVGGVAYLNDVLNCAPSLKPSVALAYARRVVLLSRQRELLAALQEAEARVYVGLPSEEWPTFVRELGEQLDVGRTVGPSEEGWAARAIDVPPEWCTTSPPARTWLLRDMRSDRGSLPLGKTGMLLAEGGAGKTTLLCQLALSVATGEPFLDWLEVSSPGRVLLIMGEEERDDMHRQLHRAAAARGIRLEPGRIVVLPLHGQACAMLERDRDGNVRDTAFATWLYGFVRGQSFSLVVLDPVSRFAGLEAETDNAQATRYVQSTEKIGTLCGATVLNSHHTNKTSRGGGGVTSASSRGSSAFTDGHRWVATLAVPDAELEAAADRLGEIVTLSFAKNNYELRGKPLLLRRAKTGALEPIEEGEAANVRRVQTGEAARHSKRESRAAERASFQRQKEEAEAQARAAKEAALLAARRDREAKDDLEATRLLKAHPEATTRELVARLKSVRLCGSDRAHEALLRVAGLVVPGVPGVPESAAVPEKGSDT